MCRYRTYLAPAPSHGHALTIVFLSAPLVGHLDEVTAASLESWVDTDLSDHTPVMARLR